MTSERGEQVLIAGILIKIQSFALIFAAQKYAESLRRGANVPVDVGDEIEMSLPDFADHERIRR